MYAAWREHRNAHAAANSAGSPNRFMGARSAIRRRFSSEPARWRRRSVRIASGARQLTVIRSAASSSESDLARPVTAARSELESRRLAIGCRTEIEVMNTRRPWSELLRCGSAAWTRRTALINVRSKAFSQASSGRVSNTPGGGPPALTTTMSRAPRRSIASLTRASGSPAFERSRADEPAAPISSAAASIDFGSRELMNTAAPSAASASAQARPRPLLAAVTSALRPFKPRSMPKIVLPTCGEVPAKPAEGLPRGVDVPVGHVLEPIVRLDRLVEVHPVHPLRDGVLVAARVEKDRRSEVGHQHLEVDVRRQPLRRLEGRPPVLQVLA